MRRGPVPALAAALLAALALGACTEEDRLTKQQYERRLTAVANRMGRAIEQIFASPQIRSPGSLEETAGVIRRGAGTIRQAAGELGGLRPPEEAQAAHDKLVHGFRQFADDLEQVARDAEEGDVDAVREFAEQARAQALPAAELITEALEELRAKGFDVGA